MSGVPKPLYQLLEDTNAKDTLRAWTAWRDALYPLIRPAGVGGKDEPNSVVRFPNIGHFMSMAQPQRNEVLRPPLKEDSEEWRKQVAKYGELAQDFDKWRQQVVKYGELAQVTYDGLRSTNVYSPNFGGCRFKPETDFSSSDVDYLTSLGPDSRNYKVVELLFADSGFYNLVESGQPRKNFMGYIAKECKPNVQKGDDVEVVIAWRGTIMRSEWFSNVKFPQVKWNAGEVVAKAPNKPLKLNPLEVLGVKWCLLACGGLSLAKWHASLLPGALSSVLAASPWAAVALVSVILGVVQGVRTTLSSKHYLLLSGVPDDNLDGKADTGKVTPALLWKDVQEWPGLIKESVKFFATTLWLTQISADARVEYGFKQVYAEADPEVLFQANGAGTKPTGTPRMQVYRTLKKLADELEKEGLKIGRIVTTGHSLGGALASLNAFDLSTTLSGSCRKPERIRKAAVGEDVKSEAQQDAEKELVDNIEYVREHVRKTASLKSPMPITACTFASPRTGDIRFAKAFGDYVKPFDGGLASAFWFWFDQSIGFAIWFAILSSLLTKTVGVGWADAGVLSVLSLATWAALPCARELASPLIGSENPPSKEKLTTLKMLRVVHDRDLVPKIPRGWLTILNPYRHAGLSLTRDMYPVDVYNKKPSNSPPILGGAGIGERHNLEVYLHMVDPSRDPAFLNKSSAALVDEAQIPPNWRNPDINKGLTLSLEGLWREAPFEGSAGNKRMDNEMKGYNVTPRGYFPKHEKTGKDAKSE